MAASPAMHYFAIIHPSGEKGFNTGEGIMLTIPEEEREFPPLPRWRPKPESALPPMVFVEEEPQKSAEPEQSQGM